jgi:hypothetical protein
MQQVVVMEIVVVNKDSEIPEEITKFALFSTFLFLFLFSAFVSFCCSVSFVSPSQVGDKTV